jgi:hypothetical protein
MDGNRYDGFEMYTAMEEISNYLSKVQLIVEDLLGASEEHVVSFNKALQSGLSPCRLSQLGREVYLRSSLLLDNVREIEAALMRFDIHIE